MYSTAIPLRTDAHAWLALLWCLNAWIIFLFMSLLCPHCLVSEAAYVLWDGEGGKKNKIKPLHVSNFGLPRSPKAKKAQSRSKGLSTGHPIHVGVSGIPTAGSRGEVWRRVWKVPRHVIVSVLIKLQNTPGSWFKALIKSALKVNLVACWPFCLYNNLQV